MRARKETRGSDLLAPAAGQPLESRRSSFEGQVVQRGGSPVALVRKRWRRLHWAQEKADLGSQCTALELWWDERRG